MNNRLEMIQKLQKQVPILDAQAEKQLQAGNTMQMQKALGEAKPTQNTTQVAQDIGTQATAMQASTAIQSAAQTQQRQAGLSQDAIQTTAAQDQQDLAARSLDQQSKQAEDAATQTLRLERERRKSQKKVTKKEIDTANRLSEIGIYQNNRVLNLSLDQRKQLEKLGRDVQEKIFNSRMRFAESEAGRRFTNQRQLADYNVLAAKNDIELNNRLREMEQAHQFKLKALETANNVLTREIDQMSKSKDQARDFEHRKALLQKKRAIEAEIARQQAKAKNTQMIFQGVGTVAGAVAGAYFAGDPYTGAALGASAGGAVGNMAYGTAANQGAV